MHWFAHIPATALAKKVPFDLQKWAGCPPLRSFKPLFFAKFFGIFYIGFRFRNLLNTTVENKFF